MRFVIPAGLTAANGYLRLLLFHPSDLDEMEKKILSSLVSFIVSVYLQSFLMISGVTRFILQGATRGQAFFKGGQQFNDIISNDVIILRAGLDYSH